ncbi:MAG: O-antigen ligase family protein [Leptolyngbyaceae cyanobacterium SL_5_9]|nr:O-antigen ligase family protein [Leptolyngbyaceae cyanobacterium SL_5_9]NJO76363.1 O-antigen ligase family protein [Leptolyngbyaceae cyanobacterium RM1_406_9]
MVESRTFRFYQKVSRFSLISLPYLNYLSFLGLFVVLVFLIRQFYKTVLQSQVCLGLLVVSGLMILSSSFAFSKEEAFLQLTNFLPFFVFFAFLRFLLKGSEKLEQLATDLVITSIPINIVAFVEYLIKSPYIPTQMQRWKFIDWLRSAPHKERAMVMFEHPNALASYLVLILGLGLGLILLQSVRQRDGDRALKETASHRPSLPQSTYLPSWLVYAAVYLNLLGIFSSGSRNGILIAISQLVAFSFFVKASRTILISGLLSLLGVLISAALVGIGGRAVSLEGLTADPRVGVWQIALELIWERPLLGWGLGNYKFLYPARIIDPVYDKIFHPHNFWLLLASEAGLLVMIGLTAVIGYICFRAVRSLVTNQLAPGDRPLLLGYLFAFWGCVAFALFDVTFYDARINVLNWVILAAIYSFTESSVAKPIAPSILC